MKLVYLTEWRENEYGLQNDLQTKSIEIVSALVFILVIVKPLS